MKLKIPPPIQTLIAAIAMFGVDNLIELKILKSDYSTSIATVFGGVSVFFIVFAIFRFIKHKTTVNPLKPEDTSFLVTTGVYKYSRNPMYAGMALFLLAWTFILANPLNLIIFITYITFMTYFQIKPEEAALMKLFGEEYAQYCQSVRRWL